MKRLLLLPCVLGMALLSVFVASAATSTNLIVTPTTAVFDSNNVTGVPGDAAPGFDSGSLASDGSGKTDMYFTPVALFSRNVTLGEVASISYWTKKGTTHVADPRDWYLTIYTENYTGDASSATWYGDRIGAEPYFSANLTDPANSWNQWSSDGSTNQLRFFESTLGYFGGYGDPHWATFVASSALSGASRSGQEVLFFSIQTGSAWADGFTGQVDGLRIELTDGSVATVNFEADYCQPGYYSATGTQPCTAADPGRYVDTAGATSQTLCPLGTYQPDAASTFCLASPAGKYVDTVGATAASLCAVGTFQAFTGQTSCDLAPEGSFVDTVGAIAASPCALGSYQPSEGQTSCLLADPGYFVDTIGAVQQTPCPAGTTSGAGASACTAIPVPTSSGDCKNNGWKNLVDSNGTKFKNQGDCVSFVATKSKNTGAGGN